MKSVSRVINREPNVSEKLRAKVDSAVAALGYVPDLAARSLAGGRSFTLGILLDNPSPNYTMKLLTGAYQACRKFGYHLLIENLDSKSETLEAQIEAMLLNIRADGLILTPPLSGNEVLMDAIEARKIPYVRLAPDGFEGRAPEIAIDDEAAGRLVGEHLIALGHKRFGMVTGRAEHSDAAGRRLGLMMVLRAHGLAPPKEAYGGYVFDNGIRAGHELMQGPDRPTAIFAANDDSAAGVMAALAELRIKVPEEVSIVGFDDSWIARSVWPNLTTIYQPIAEMAARAVEILLERDTVLPEGKRIQLDFHLVERASTAPAFSG